MNIKVADLSVTFNGRKILDHIDIDFPDRKITALIGGNGSGKSTLAACIAGIKKDFDGMVLYDSVPVKKYSPRQLAQKRAILLQNPFAPAAMRVDELLDLGRFAGKSGSKCIDKALAEVGCTGLLTRCIGTLSGGERRKIFLALALVQEPELLILDEVESGVDNEFLRALPDLLKALQYERALTVIMVTHQLDLALHCADRIIGLKNGTAKLLAADKKSLCEFTEGNIEFITAPDGSLRAVTAFTRRRMG